MGRNAVYILSNSFIVLGVIYIRFLHINWNYNTCSRPFPVGGVSWCFLLLDPISMHQH